MSFRTLGISPARFVQLDTETQVQLIFYDEMNRLEARLYRVSWPAVEMAANVEYFKSMQPGVKLSDKAQKKYDEIVSHARRCMTQHAG